MELPNSLPTSLHSSSTSTDEELLTSLDMPNEKKFRLQNHRFMLTYKNHHSKEWLYGHLLTLAESKKSFDLEKFKCYIAGEHGEGDKITPYKHMHVVIDFGFKFESTNCRIFDIVDQDTDETIHPHISVIKTPLNWKKACKYICKEDEECRKSIPSSDLPDDDIITRVWQAKTAGEALVENAKKFSDVTGILAAYKMRPREAIPRKPLDEDKLYPWQLELKKIIEGEPDDRTVMWIYDKVGGTGKTKFCQMMCFNYPDKCRMINTVGQNKDFAQNIFNFIEKENWRGNTLFINLSRSYEDKCHIYKALEDTADGCITCEKYEGGVVWLPCMHVVVMANFKPKWNNLSHDRWYVREIIGQEFSKNPVPIEFDDEVDGR